MKFTSNLAALVLLFTLINSCSTNQLGSHSTPLRQVANAAEVSASAYALPEITVDKGELATALKTALKKSANARDFKKAESAISIVWV